MKNKIQYESIVESESLCAPAVRMVLASVWLSPEGEAILFRYPVLAIRSRSNLVFSRAMNSNNEYATPEISAEAMLENGWTFCERENEVEAIINDADWELIGHGDSLLKEPRQKSELVELPWPWDEARDDEAVRLAHERIKERLK